MKYICILLFIAIGCNSKITEEDFYNNGVIKTRIVYTDKSRNEFTKESYRKDGRIKSKEHFLNGLLHGETIHYPEFETGYCTLNYDFGKMNGTRICKDKNGIIRARFVYVNDLLMSECHYYANGIHAGCTIYSEPDKGNGKTLMYFTNGNLEYSGYTKNYKHDSIWTQYDSTGKKIAIIMYKENEEVSKKIINQISE